MNAILKDNENTEFISDELKRLLAYLLNDDTRKGGDKILAEDKWLYSEDVATVLAHYKIEFCLWSKNVKTNVCTLEYSGYVNEKVTTFVHSFFSCININLI